MNELDFGGKTVVITGGTRGIGYATAEVFLRHGARVVIFGSRAETVETALKGLLAVATEAAKCERNRDRSAANDSTDGAKGPQNGSTSGAKGPVGDAKAILRPEERILGYHPNLSSERSLGAVFEEIHDKCGSIDVLINNAGMASSTPFADFTEEEYDKIAELNIKSVFMTTRAALPYLIESKGVVLNTSSMVSLYGQPSGVMYPASKYAVNGITKSLARELAREGVRVNAVAPGIIETDMMKKVPEEMIAPLIASIPLGRVGQGEDIANAFLFLASPLASYISGVVLPVDGLARS